MVTVTIYMWVTKVSERHCVTTQHIIVTSQYSTFWCTLTFWFEFFKLGKNWWKTDDRSDDVNERTLWKNYVNPNWVKHDCIQQYTVRQYKIVLKTCASTRKHSGCTVPVHGTVQYTAKIWVTQIEQHHPSYFHEIPQQDFSITSHSTRTKTKLHINMIVTLTFWFEFFELGKNWWKTDDKSDEVNEGSLVCENFLCIQTGWNTTV